MKLGAALRWAALSHGPTASRFERPSDNSSYLERCYVSLVLIQWTYGANLYTRTSTIGDEEAALLLASSTYFCSPAAPTPMSDTLRNIEDLGIGRYLASLTFAWGKLVEYLVQVRRGTGNEKMWQPDSSYYQLMARIYDFEISCSENHRLKALNPEARPPTDFANHNSYWTMWFTMQILYHAYQAVLNHPLLLIFQNSSRHAGKTQQPPSFMQHNVDQAMLHASWVVRMIEIWQSKELESYNPFVGHLVGAVATVHFLLCFAKDDSVAEKALHDFHRCSEHVKDISQRWSHIRHVVSSFDPVVAHPSDPNVAGEIGRT